MKGLLPAIVLVLWSFGALAQGKVRFVNDSLHCVYFTTDTSLLLIADQGLAGQAVPSTNGPLPSGITLVPELWAGTSQSSLGFVGTDINLFNTGIPGTFDGGHPTTAGI